MEEQQVIPTAVERELANVPRARNTAYLTTYQRDRRVHRLLVKVPITVAGTWTTVNVQLPQLDQLGNGGYTVMCERCVLRFSASTDQAQVQPWLKVETLDLTEGRMIDRANFFQAGYTGPDESITTMATYAEWYMRAIHQADTDTAFLFEPTGPVQDYVVPHDRMQFPFQVRIYHTATGEAVGRTRWAELVLAFVPNNNKMYGP